MIFENDTPLSGNKRGYKKSNQEINLYGKIPPQALDLEEAVLGALMLSTKLSPAIWGSLKAEYFYELKHQKIFESLIKIRHQGRPVDILTATAQLRQEGNLELIGGAYYITELTNRVANTSNIETHIKIIHQQFILREIIRHSTEAASNCYSGEADPFEEMSKVVNAMDQLKKEVFKRSEKNIGQLLIEVTEERWREKINGLIGLSTGFDGIDFVTQGDQDGQLIIYAARPGMGKTALMCSQMVSAVYDYKSEKFLPLKDQTPVGCFSLEMSGVQLGFRMLSNVSQVDSKKIKKNTLTQEEHKRVDYYSDQLSDAKIWVDDTAGLTIDEFETKASIWVAKYGIKKIYIDYLQLMGGRAGKKYANREAVVSDITRSLKIIAKNLGITIIALCQLSRDVEKRPDKKPQLSDLRESGSIEQDADVVIFLWRPEYYPDLLSSLGKIGIKLFGFDLEELHGVIIAIVGKCREEATGNVPLRFRGSIMRVQDHPFVLDAVMQKLKSERDMFDITNEQGDAPF